MTSNVIPLAYSQSFLDRVQQHNYLARITAFLTNELLLDVECVTVSQNEGKITLEVSAKRRTT
jgi:hypothetical protein